MIRNTHTSVTDDMALTGKVVTRIAPSPTGAFHIGTARTALFNYLFARKYNGSFIVRFEDTDYERSERRYKREILNALQWLSLSPDSVVQQSDRRSVYRRYIRQMLDGGTAYLSKEPAKKDPTQEVEVVRFKNTKQHVSFTDTLRGEVIMDISDLGDFVIARGVADPLYNLAVVIDDIEMGITHVLRGDDHIANTPRQIALIESLGETPPVYIHIPLIHAPGGGKLSKRKADAVSVGDFKEAGYLPEALINMIALLGWNPKEDREMFLLDELVQAFSLEQLQKKEAVFNEEKLRWFNKQYMKTVGESRLRGGVVPAIVTRFPIRSRLRPRAVKKILADARERGMPFREEREHIASGSYDFYFTKPEYDPLLLVPKGAERRVILNGLRETERLLNELGAYEDWTEECIQKKVWNHAEEHGKGTILWPLRFALTGKEKSPGPFIVAEVLGKKETMARLSDASTGLAGIL